MTSLPRALALSARQADFHLYWIEPLADSKARFDALRAELGKTGRSIGMGIRTHLVVRDNEEDAWKAANELIAHADPAVRPEILHWNDRGDDFLPGLKAIIPEIIKHRPADRIAEGLAPGGEIWVLQRR